MFERQVQTEKRINLYVEVARHYHVIVNITAAMAKRYACNKGCYTDVHKLNRCVVIVSVPPCAFSHFRIPCESCNRTFRSQTF